MSQTKIFLYSINFTKLFKRYSQINVWIFNGDSNSSEKTNGSFPGTIKHSYFHWFFSQRWSGRNSTNPLVQWIGLRVRATFNIMLVTFRGLLHICAGRISTKIKRERYLLLCGLVMVISASWKVLERFQIILQVVAISSTISGGRRHFFGNLGGMNLQH